MHKAAFLRPIAHRGLHDRSKGVIENSRSAFEAAVDRNFGIECDLQLTADGEAVVFHDYDLERLVGTSGAVRDVTAAQLGTMPLLGSSSADCPQTFETFLDQVGGQTPLVVEIKQQADARQTELLATRVVQNVASYHGDFVIKSFDPRMLMAVRKAGYSGPLGIITYGYDRPDWYGDMPARQRFVLRHLLHYPWSRFTFISCERTALPRPAIRMFRALGQKVMSWTIKSPAEAANARKHADQIVFEGFDPDL